MSKSVLLLYIIIADVTRVKREVKIEKKTHKNTILSRANSQATELSSATGSSEVVVVRKRDGKIRLCVDLREPNKCVIMDCYPLPHMEDLFTELAGASHYSQIYLSSAYHQLPLHPDSRNLTAFITQKGLFRFTRVPFGLASAPSAFQKNMQTVLRKLDGVKNYLDDIIVYGNSQETHDKHLQALRQRLEEVDLQINFDKTPSTKRAFRFWAMLFPKKDYVPAQIT